MSDKRPVVYEPGFHTGINEYADIYEVENGGRINLLLDNEPPGEFAELWTTEQDAAAILLAYQRGELCFRDDMPVCPYCEIQHRAMAGSKARCCRCGSRLRPIKDISHEIEFADDDDE